MNSTECVKTDINLEQDKTDIRMNSTMERIILSEPWLFWLKPNFGTTLFGQVISDEIVNSDHGIWKLHS